MNKIHGLTISMNTFTIKKQYWWSFSKLFFHTFVL